MKTFSSKCFLTLCSTAVPLRTSLVKTNQSLKLSGVKIWNSLPRHIRDKVSTFRDKTSSKTLKLYFLKSRTCLQAKPLFTCVNIKMQAYLRECVIPFFPFLFFTNFFFLISKIKTKLFFQCQNPATEFCTISKRRSRLGDRDA